MSISGAGKLSIKDCVINILDFVCSTGASQVALVVKNLPANVGDLRDVVGPLGWEDPLEEEMATHSSILAWRIPWTEQPGGLQPMRSQRVGQMK